MIFVELAPFVDFRERYWTDEEFAALEGQLLITPAAGASIRGSGGLRKIRWSVRRRGKRGGARVIYYWHRSADCIYLICAYSKSTRENLTRDELEQVRRLLGNLGHG